MDSDHGLWTSAGVAGPRVHHGLPPWLMARARRSLAQQPLWATEARREGGDGTGTTRRDRETTHLSPDDGEKATHRRRSKLDAGVEESKRELQSEGRRCGSDRGSLGVYIGPGGAPERG
jgi:hypothetical protein